MIHTSSLYTYVPIQGESVKYTQFAMGFGKVFELME